MTRPLVTIAHLSEIDRRPRLRPLVQAPAKDATRKSRYAVLLAASVLFSAASMIPVLAGEFKGSATMYWAYHDLSVVRISDSSTSSVGVADGPNIFEGGGAELVGIAQHCLNTNNPDGSSGGVCHNLDPSGDGWKETYTCDAPLATPTPGALVTCIGKSEVIPGSGTGKFAKIAGGSTTVQDVTGVLLDGVLVGWTVQKYDLTY